MARIEVSTSRRKVRVGPIPLDRIALSLPLARSIDTRMTLERWQDFCEQVIGKPGRGMECVWDENDCIMGLMAYHVQPEPRCGRILIIDPFLAADLCGRDCALKALMARVEEIATTHDCAAARLFITGRAGREQISAVEKSTQHGFTVLTLCATKPLSDQAASLLGSTGSDRQNTVPSGPVLTSDRSPP
ncbi:MAG: hypothetical protein RIM33_08980 [Alphaproteobacteria bacterium]